MHWQDFGFHLDPAALRNNSGWGSKRISFEVVCTPPPLDADIGLPFVLCPLQSSGQLSYDSEETSEINNNG